MFKYFASSLIAFALIAKAQDTTTVIADESSPCAVCWDGSLGLANEDGNCQCPALPVDEPDIPEENTDDTDSIQEANPNCTTGNRQSCDRSGGDWDYVSCFCTFPETEEPQDEGGFDFVEEPVQPVTPVEPEQPEQPIEPTPSEIEQEEEPQYAEIDERGGMPGQDLMWDYENLQLANRKWGVYTLVATLVSTYEIGYAQGELDQKMKEELEVEPGLKSKHNGDYKNYRDKNKGEEAWAQALEVQWMYWTNMFVFWMIYNLKVPSHGIMYLLAYISPFLGLSILWFHFMINEEGGCDNGEEVEWEMAIGIHVSMMIGLARIRTDFLRFLDAEKYREGLEFVDTADM